MQNRACRLTTRSGLGAKAMGEAQGKLHHNGQERGKSRACEGLRDGQCEVELPKILDKARREANSVSAQKMNQL